ncbi:PKD domain-containing protein [Flavobacterium suzhouense]|uniref:PKD domain-containing protein n=1 Tax=Flavobacterium suzhouense TaxID=1529638 RepID=A0ABW5NTZ4_9FLAO
MKKAYLYIMMFLLLSGYTQAQTGCNDLPASLTQVTPSDFANNIYTIDFARPISLTADVDPTGIDPTAVIYQWDFGNGVILYGKTITYTSVQEGQVTLTLTTTYQGCVTVRTFTFNVQKGVPFSLYRQFNGRYDYTAIGNTLNLQENAGILVSDECGVLTQSSATLSLQPGHTIVAAYLYWAGSGLGDFDVKLNNIDVTAQRTFYSTISVSANNPKPSFGAFADVTNIVASSGTYTLSDLDITQTIADDTDYCYSAINFAGWSVIIIYADNTLPYNQVAVYDGFKGVDAQNPTLNIYLDNLNVISNTGAKIGFLAWEGDNGIAVNETVNVNGSVLSNPPLNPANNAFNGTNSFTGASDLWNMDIDYYNIQNYIAVGDTDLDVSLTSGQDGIIMNNIVTVINSELPDASIEMIFLSGNEVCLNRDLQLVYMAKNYNSTDVLPANTPIAIYADDVLIATTATTADLPIDGSEVNVLSVTLPSQIPDEFTLKFVIDDNGTGTGIVRETDETNNEYSETVILRQGIEPQDVESELFTCFNGTTGTFDLTQATENVTADYAYDFYATQADADAESNPIINDTNYISGNATVYVRIYDFYSPTCYEIMPITLTLVDCQPHKPEDVEVCAPIGQNFVAFNLNNFEAEILDGRPAADYTITFHNTALGAQDDNDFVSDPATFVVNSGTQVTVYIRMETSGNANLFGTTDFAINVISPPTVSPATPLEECADNFDGYAYFDLTPAGVEILNGQSGLTITYHSTQAAAEFGVNPITDPTNYHSILGTVYASVVQTGTTTNCRSVVPIQLIVHPRPAIPVMTAYELCDDDTDGLQVFDLTTKDLEATGGDTTLTTEYYLSSTDAQAGNNPIANPATFGNTTPNSQPVWVAVITGFGCRSIASFNVVVNPLPVLSTDPIGL